MDPERPFEFGGNPLRLSWRQWAAVAAVLAPVLFLLPGLWRWLEPFQPAANYRVPYEFSQDYWQCERWYDTAAGSGAVLVVGDSVVWGEFAGLAETFSGQLNGLAGRADFANLGINGLHPAAMLGMLRLHGGAIRNRQVIVVLNALWMSSPKHDLREAPANWEEAQGSFNHPGLMPQLGGGIPRYVAPLEQRAGYLVERAVPFCGWMAHLKAKGSQTGEPGAVVPGGQSGGEGAEPRIDNPSPRPFRNLLAAVPPPAPGAHGQQVSWEERGIPVTTLAWPGAEASLQAKCFRDVVSLLRGRRNRVYVFVNPFNPYVQTPESRERHDALVAALAEALASIGVPVFRGTPLPSGEYADASHPLPAGYARLARELTGNAQFQAWKAEGGESSRRR